MNDVGTDKKSEDYDISWWAREDFLSHAFKADSTYVHVCTCSILSLISSFLSRYRRKSTVVLRNLYYTWFTP